MRCVLFDKFVSFYSCVVKYGTITYISLKKTVKSIDGFLLTYFNFHNIRLLNFII